jgi:tetratricopeptide (TPR) repeat protein
MSAFDGRPNSSAQHTNLLPDARTAGCSSARTATARALTSAGPRDARNADIQNYLGYAYRRLRQVDPAMRHYQQALMLNSRHRSAHEHLGEAYLAQGDLTKAEEHLMALERICLIPCDEYNDLKGALATYDKATNRSPTPLLAGAKG